MTKDWHPGLIGPLGETRLSGPQDLSLADMSAPDFRCRGVKMRIAHKIVVHMVPKANALDDKVRRKVTRFILSRNRDRG